MIKYIDANMGQRFRIDTEPTSGRAGDLAGQLGGLHCSWVGCHTTNQAQLNW